MNPPGRSRGRSNLWRWASVQAWSKGTVICLHPEFYYFHPLLAGPRISWPLHLQRCRAMGFEYVLTAPLFAPGAAGDLFLTADHEKPHPAIEQSLNADQLIAELAENCRDAGLKLLLDLVLGRVASDASVTQSHPEWFADDVITGHAVDPRSALPAPAAAYLRFAENSADGATAWWIERLLRLANAGASGFCLSQPQLVPRDVWRQIIDCRWTEFSRHSLRRMDAGTALARDRDAARGWFRWRVLVRAMVGRPRQLVCRRA